MIQKPYGGTSKRTVREIEQEDGVLIFDDTFQEKPYTDENELVCWHFDHTQGRSVKGINLLNCLYHAGGVALPVAFELVRKPRLYSDVATRQAKRKSDVTRNDDVATLNRTHSLKYLQEGVSINGSRKTESLYG